MSIYQNIWADSGYYSVLLWGYERDLGQARKAIANMNLEKRHIEYLKEEIGLSEEEFHRICESDGSEEFEALVMELGNRECDVALNIDCDDETEEHENIPADLVDYMCGPYDE